VELVSDVRLTNGGRAHIRPICPADTVALGEFHDRLSSETVYRRFFGTHPHLTAEEKARFAEVDYHDRLALVAEVDGQLAGVARYDRRPGSDRAEVAFVVADALQSHGLGALLLEHLSLAARRRGVAVFEAQTLGGNYPMQKVFRHAGFSCTQRWTQGVVDVAFPIAPTQAYLEAVLARELLSVRAALPPAPEGNGGLGIVCRSAATAEALLSICRSARVRVASALVTDDLDIDLHEGLLLSGMGTGADVVAVELAGLALPRRFVAVAREVTRSRPVVSLSPAGTSTSWCRQAGVEPVHRVEDLVDRVRERMDERHRGTWQAPVRGRLTEVVDCDVFRARAALDKAVTSKPSDGCRPARLDPASTSEVLAAYGMTERPSRGRGARGRFELTLEDLPGLGLVARVGPSVAGAGQKLARLLPLTQVDADELVDAAGLAAGDAAVVTDAPGRAARLIGDQPDIVRVRIPLGGDPACDRGDVELWTGPVRGTDDDPFIRRLPAKRRFSRVDEVTRT
jgi:GNAT superfamily N-acetyltransferase